MKEATRVFLQKKFLDYYKHYESKIPPPTSIGRREFGFLLFKDRMMVRHRGFIDVDQLRKALIEINPSDAYHSGAYYDYPTEEMDKKGWQGADLIFDIDADHLDTDCRGTHTVWICEKCKRAEIGNPPERCPECGDKIQDANWICEDCLEATKSETNKLIDILTDDFGFLCKDIFVCFSGNRGYHVHVETGDIMRLDQLARKEIVDYIRGTGLEMSLYGLSEESFITGRSNLGPDRADPGWRGRLARATYDLLISMSKEDLIREVGLPSKTSETVISERNNIIEFWNGTPPWHSIKGIGAKGWNKIIQFAIKSQAVDIDTVVTSDVHRLIRLPETLHGKTGFRTATVPIEELQSFDPLSEAQVFQEGTIKVHVLNSPQFRLGEETQGPFRDETVELPTAAAVMLMCKGLAMPQD